MCKFLICMIDAYKCILRMMSQIRRRWLWTCWYTDGLIRGGYGRIRRIDGLILMLPPKGKGFFLYTHLCVLPFIYLSYFFISIFICIFWSIFVDLFWNIHYILYLSAFLHLFFPSSHIHIYISTNLSMYLPICIYFLMNLPIYVYKYMFINLFIYRFTHLSNPI